MKMRLHRGHHRLLPTLDRIVTEGHVARVVILVPLGMAIGEKDILAERMDLPEFIGRTVGRTADAILRVVIFIGIQRIKNAAVFATGHVRNATGVARQNEIGRKPDALAILPGHHC